MSESEKFSRYQTLVVLLLSLTQFTVVLDFMVMSPLGDLLIKQLRISPSQFGIVVSSYAISAGFSGFFTASFADKFDRKKLLLLFYAGFIIGTTLCGLADTYEFLVFARIITGIFGGVISSISLAIVADLFSFNQRGRVMSFIQMGFGMSQIVGIPLSLYIAHFYNWQMPFFLIVGLALLFFISIAFFLRPVDQHLQIERSSALTHMIQTFSNKNYQIGFVATMFMSLGGYLMMPWGSAYSVNNIGISQSDLPIMFMVVGIATFLIMPIAGVLSDKFNKFSVFATASIIMVISVVIYTHLPKVPLSILVIVNVLMMMGIMSRMIPSQALTSSIPEMKDRGAFMSINTSLQQLAGGVASLIGGWIVTQKNEMSPLENFDTLGYVVIVIILINIFLTYRVHLYVSKKNQE